MAGNGIVTILMLMLLLLVLGKSDHFSSLSINDPPITTHQAPASPNPISTPSKPASPHPINKPSIPARLQLPAGPLSINTLPELPSPIPSPIPIDTRIVFPSLTLIDLPIIPLLPIPGIGVPKNRRCVSMCSKSCSLQKNNRFAYFKCRGLCNLNCVRGISDIISDCTNNCVESKSLNFNLANVGDVVNHVSSCYAGCKKNH